MAVRDFLGDTPPRSGSTSRQTGLSPEVQKLAATVYKQKLKTDTPVSSSPGVLERIFDVVSRPLYTVANAADYTVQGQNPLEGAYRGLAGQDKTTFDKVLGDVGMSGGFQRALLGFGLDVVADPTTYLGVGTVKGLTEGAAKKFGEKAVANVDRKLLQGVADQAIKDEFIASGGKIVSGATKTKVEQRAVADHLAGVARKAEDKALQSQRGRAFIKYMGKEVPILPKATGESIYGVGSKVANTLNKSSVIQDISKAFRPKATFSQGTNDLLRESVGHSFFDGEEYVRGLKKEFGHLAPGEREMIFHAIENGTDLSAHKMAPFEFQGKKYDNLEHYKQSVVDRLDSLKSIEQALGILGKNDELYNYVPHILKSGDREAYGAFKAERKKLQGVANAKGIKNPSPVVQSAKQAADKGFKLETDVVQALSHRAISSFKDQGMWRFANAVENEFGIHLGTDVKKLAKSFTETKNVSVTKSLSEIIHEPSGEGLQPLYHGTSKKIETLGDKYSSGSGADNLYGPGFYTTESKPIASQYIKKGGKDSPTLYHATWTGEGKPKFIDLDKPLSSEIKSHFVNHVNNMKELDFSMETESKLNSLISNPDSTGKEFYQTFKKAYSELHWPKYEVDDALSSLSDLFEQKGFAGFTHIGGGDKVNHKVHIFFDPTKVAIKDISKDLPSESIVKQLVSSPGVHINKDRIPSLAKEMNLVEGKNKYLSGKGVYFHPDVARALKTIERINTDPAAGAALLRHFDKIQNIWKLNMTALNPGHHIRNFAGDVFLNFEDGVINPARYLESAKVLKSWRENPTSVFVQVGKRRLNAQQVMDLFASKGGKSGFFRTELVASGIKPIEKIRELAETREDWTRLAHFIDVLKKEGKNVKTLQELDDVAKTAGQRVRKFNIDYGDLTPFERNGMKRVVPFYTWMRKNIPVQLETLALNPGKVNAIPKFMNFLNKATGQEGQNPELFGLNLTPLWLRQMAAVRVAGEGQGRNGLYWDPSVIPFMDIGRYSEGGIGGIAANALGATTPALRMPIEQAFGRSLLTQGPLQDEGRGYLGSSVLPPQWLKLAGMVSGQKEILGIPTSSKGFSSDIAKLAGLTLQPLTDIQMRGELRRQQDPLQSKIKSMKARALADYQKAKSG